MDLHRLTTDQILEEMEKCEEIADVLQAEVIARAKGITLQETELCDLTTDAILAKAEDCQQAWITFQEVIISRAKERDVLAALVERIRMLLTSPSSEKGEYHFNHFLS
jgi:hypothetical protein